MAGKSAAKKLKKIYFFQTYIFLRAGRGKIGGKKRMRKIYIFFTYIFWRAGHWKIGGKKTEKI